MENESEDERGEGSSVRRRGARKLNQNAEQLQEYRSILREILAHQIMGHAVYKAVIPIAKTILVIGIIIVLSFVFQFEWIARILVVFVFISAGLRFLWLWWHGRRDSVIRIPIDF